MKCFVIAPFSMPFDEYYHEIIVPATKSAGFEVIRANEVYSVRPIMEDVVEGIVNADVIIAEVTTRNPNVNYELGMAHALGKPTVIISQSIEDIPFDYKHVRAILYNTTRYNWAAQLKHDIATTLQEVLKNPGPTFLHKTLEEFQKRSSPVDSWGLNRIYGTRQEMNIRVDSLFEHLHDNLDICAFGLKSFRDAKNQAIRQKVKDGLRLRILAPHPDSSFLVQRERDENVMTGEISKRVRDLYIWVRRLQDLSPETGRVILKSYNALPLDFYWHQQLSWLFVGPYMHGIGSQQTITYEFVKGGRGYNYFTAYFDELWNDESFASELF